MRLPSTEHESRPWRIHEIVHDFTLEDVWALPIHGGPEDFEPALQMMGSFDPTDSDSVPARVLWRIRDLLGRWFDLGRIAADDAPGELPIPGTDERCLADRLPADLRGTAGDVHFGAAPFVPLYQTYVGGDAEFAAEVSNKTVHGALHLGWVGDGDGRYHAEMAVYVKPRGTFGTGYMALIRPFRHWIVYPALMRQIERQWASRARGGDARRDPPSTRSGS
jgi:hypothetical protein